MERLINARLEVAATSKILRAVSFSVMVDHQHRGAEIRQAPALVHEPAHIGRAVLIAHIEGREGINDNQGKQPARDARFHPVADTCRARLRGL